MSAEVTAATAAMQITDEKVPQPPETATTTAIDDKPEPEPALEVAAPDAPVKSAGQTAADHSEPPAPAPPATVAEPPATGAELPATVAGPPATVTEPSVTVAEPLATAADTADGALDLEELSGPLLDLGKKLAATISEAGHAEMWGVDLTNIRDVPTCVVLQKFLRANNSDVDKAQKQLLDALKWRKQFKPTAALDELHNRKFNGLGFVTAHKPATEDIGQDVIICWNIYGGVKDRKATFSNLEEFMRWRVALMELSIQKLNLAELTKIIPEGAEDPYRMIQVHDYMDVSFLRLDPDTKVASRKVIEVFSMAYPELLSHKYFVNVPMIMGWLFGFFKLFVSKETLSKFHPMTNGSSLANELKPLWQTLPKAYGGNGPALNDGPSAIAPRLQAEPSANSGKGEEPNGKAKDGEAASKDDNE